MSIQDWEITSQQVIGNRKIVSASNSTSGDTLTLDVTTDPVETGYHAVVNYSRPLSMGEIATLNEKVVAPVRAKYLELGLAQPPLLSPGAALTLNVTNADFSADAGTYNVNANFALGSSFAGTMFVGAVNGSVQVSYGGASLPVMVIERGAPDAFATIENLTVHRTPANGSLDVSFNGKGSGGVLVADVVTIPAVRPPSGPNTLFGLELNFAGGTVAAPITLVDASAVDAIGQAIFASFDDGCSLVMACASEGKYLCLRHLLKHFGLGTLCIIAVIIAAGGTAGTGGAAAPALVGAVIACAGAVALNVIDAILAHLGFA